MNFYAYEDLCLCPMGGRLPQNAAAVAAPFAPLVFLLERDPACSRGIFAVRSLSQVTEPEDLGLLLPGAPATGVLAGFVAANGAVAVNTAFANWYGVLRRTLQAKSTGLRLNVVGLGDVGGTFLTGLTLLGGETVRQIGIYDPNEALCARYEMELNQILPVSDAPMPRVTLCEKRDLFDCDAFVFTASRGVPPVGAQGDVRMAQLEKNREMLKSYSRQARDARFSGLFFQVSDPVDLLARSVFWQTNRDNGTADFAGLLPEQIQGCGLGVMAARAAYYAGDFSRGRVYGPHGEGLVAANDWGQGYDDALSQKLTALARSANVRVRELGFKPYIAPGLSSACISILQALRGQYHYGTAPIGGVCFGCRSRYTPYGLELERLPLAAQLRQRIAASYADLKEMEPQCRL